MKINTYYSQKEKLVFAKLVAKINIHYGALSNNEIMCMTSLSSKYNLSSITSSV